MFFAQQVARKANICQARIVPPPQEAAGQGCGLFCDTLPFEYVFRALRMVQKRHPICRDFPLNFSQLRRDCDMHKMHWSHAKRTIATGLHAPYVPPIERNETPPKQEGILDMAVLDYNRSLTENRGIVAQTLGLFNAAIANLIAWNDARVTRKSLSSLSDRELEDLGLVRGDIEDIAQGTYAR